MKIESELITISKEVAHALEIVKKEQNNNFQTIVEYHMDKFPEWSSELTPLNALSLDSMIRALYIGYEVEKTPEEKVKELYNNYGPNSRDEQYYADERVQMGIRQTLNVLGMKVEGINDDN